MRTPLIIATIFIVAACGSAERPDASGSDSGIDAAPEATAPGDRATSTEAPLTSRSGPTVMPCSSLDDVDAIADLVQSGLPTYDYQPAARLAELTGWVDLVVAGRIDSVVRSSVEDGAGRDDATTLLSVSDVEVLSGDGEVSTIATTSVWAVRDQPDPLGEPVYLDDVSFVAYVEHDQRFEGRWVPYVDGFAFGCAGSSLPVRPLSDLPPDTANLAIEEVVAAARVAATDGREAVDGPVVRHPRRAANTGALEALISGTLEVDDGCLYLGNGVDANPSDDRYPIVWPAGTTWDADSQTVSLPTTERLTVGDSALGGGGFLKIDAVELLVGTAGTDVLATCVDNQFGDIAVVNNLDDAIGRE